MGRPIFITVGNVKSMQKFVAFLRGINVGGHHKVPMADLRRTLGRLGLEDVQTLLNSGNVIFATEQRDVAHLENTISSDLARTFGFSIPVIVRPAKSIQQLYAKNPFAGIVVTKDIRLYVTFMKKKVEFGLALPWTSDDGSYKIIDVRDDIVLSVLDLSRSKTPKAMEALEKMFGKDVTTRNWKTIERLVGKMEAGRS